MLRTVIAPLAIVLLAIPGTQAAAQQPQGRSSAGQPGTVRIPPGQTPRAGECRVWYPGVPPGQQPRATSCREAERVASRTPQARVIYPTNSRTTPSSGRVYDRGAISNRNVRVFDSRRGPRMPRTADLRRNRITRDVQREIRSGTAVRATFHDINRDGRPERVVFFDRRGSALETWHDTNRDGRVDRIVFHTRW